MRQQNGASRCPCPGTSFPSSSPCHTARIRAPRCLPASPTAVPLGTSLRHQRVRPPEQHSEVQGHHDPSPSEAPPDQGSTQPRPSIWRLRGDGTWASVPCLFSPKSGKSWVPHLQERPARVLRGDEGENSTQKRPSNMGPRDLSSMTHTLTRPGPRNAFHLLGEVPGCLPGFTFH